SEAGRRAQQPDVTGFDDGFVAVQADMFLLLLDLHLLFDVAVALEAGEASLDLFGERVGDGDQPVAFVGLEGLTGSARPAAAATDQADLQCVVTLGKGAGTAGERGGQRGSGAGSSGSLEEVAASRGRRILRHGRNL